MLIPTNQNFIEFFYLGERGFGFTIVGGDEPGEMIQINAIVATGKINERSGKHKKTAKKARCYWCISYIRWWGVRVYLVMRLCSAFPMVLTFIRVLFINGTSHNGTFHNVNSIIRLHNGHDCRKRGQFFKKKSGHNYRKRTIFDFLIFT